MSENSSDDIEREPYKYTFPPQLCDWCGEQAYLANQPKAMVCDGCYLKLAGAGLSDAEIYKKEG